MSAVTVLGLGNRLLMDDGVGVAVVETLARRQARSGPVRYEVVETDFAYGLVLAEEADRLILVDAVTAGAEPGTVSVWRLCELGSAGPGLSLHQAHLVDLLLRSGQATSAVLVGIEPFRIGFHWGLSAEMEERFERTVEDVGRVVEGMAWNEIGSTSWHG